MSDRTPDLAALEALAEAATPGEEWRDPATVLWLIREVKRLREPLDDLEIVNGWLVQRGVHEPEYPAGVAYGPMPYSDAEFLVDLSTLSGWPDITRAEKAEATIERVRELADRVEQRVAARNRERRDRPETETEEVQ